MLAATPLIAHHFQAVDINADALNNVIAEIGPIKKGPLNLEPKYQGARSTVQGVDSSGTEVFVAYFAAQKVGFEMVAYGNGVVAGDDSEWRVLSSSGRSIVIDGKQAVFREWRMRKGSVERLAWSWFTVGEKQVSNEILSKGLIAWTMLTGRGDQSVVSVVSTQVSVGPGGIGNSELSEGVNDARSRLERAARPIIKGLKTLGQ